MLEYCIVSLSIYVVTLVFVIFPFCCKKNKKRNHKRRRKRQSRSRSKTKASNNGSNTPITNNTTITQTPKYLSLLEGGTSAEKDNVEPKIEMVVSASKESRETEEEKPKNKKSEREKKEEEDDDLTELLRCRDYSPAILDDLKYLFDLLE